MGHLPPPLLLHLFKCAHRVLVALVGRVRVGDVDDAITDSIITINNGIFGGSRRDILDLGKRGEAGLDLGKRKRRNQWQCDGNANSRAGRPEIGMALAKLSS